MDFDPSLTFFCPFYGSRQHFRVDEPMKESIPTVSHRRRSLWNAASPTMSTPPAQIVAGRGTD